MGLIRDFFRKQESISVAIMAINGLHLRPCAKIASLARELSSDINFVFNAKSANAKNMNEILSLGLVYGNKITIMAKGKNAKDELEQIKILLDELSVHDIKSDDNIENSACETVSYDGDAISGKAICGGVSFAKLYQNNQLNYSDEKYDFDDAIKSLYKDLEILSKDNENSERDIFVAQKAILDTLNCSNLENFTNSIHIATSNLKDTTNESKITDYKDIEKKVRDKMNGIVTNEYPNDDFILIATELFPSDLKKLSVSCVKGIIIQNLSPRSHVALLLRGYNIPAVSLEDILTLDNIHHPIIIDSGTIVVHPSTNDIDNVQNIIDKTKEKLAKDNDDKFKLAITKSGKQINILANITDCDSAIQGKEAGCEGVGLFRTEFLFQKNKPTIDIQIKEYEKIFMLFEDITVRTLDVGGDKKLPYLLMLKEENPFLGIRGVRLFETHLEIMREQLYAILSAKRANKLKIMFPMVSTVDEFVNAKNISLEIARENNLDLTNISFGIMVEVPSVLFLISEFDKVVDFYSIGTNDLAQYLFAVDRTHTTLKIDSHSSVIFDAIKFLREQSIKPVSICGELASDIDAIKSLIEIDIDTLSVTPAMIPTIKARIRNV